MQKWEYSYILYTYKPSKLDLIQPNGQRTVVKADNVKSEDAVLLLNKLGSEGWEVVAFSEGGEKPETSFRSWTLKRPLA